MHLEHCSQRSNNYESRAKSSSDLAPIKHIPLHYLSDVYEDVSCEGELFVSENPGNPNDLPFSAREFVNACLIVQSGPFADENKDWMRVLRMYNRMVTLRIDVLGFCQKFLTTPLLKSKVFDQLRQAAKVPRIAHPFDLPFSAQEFLELIDEALKHNQNLKEDIIDSQYAGSTRLFRLMVDDLACYAINIKDFLADNIPEHMKDNAVLMCLLSCLEGEHFTINHHRFVQAITNPGPGRVISPMSHFQVAMFTQSLK